MKTILTLLFFPIFFNASAQYSFVFSDSCVYSELTPVNSKIIRAKGIKKVLVYSSYKDNKAPELLHEYLYNADGLLIKKYLYFKNKSCLRDSVTYDEQQRETGYFFGAGYSDFVHIMNFSYIGDSLIIVKNDVEINPGIRAIIDESRCLDNKGKIIKVMRVSTDAKYKENMTTDYKYDAAGYISEKRVTETDGKIRLYIYKNIFRKNKRNLRISRFEGHITDKIYEELYYNEKGQCISYNFSSAGTFHKIFYNDDGLISTDECVNCKTPVTYKYYYYNTP